MSVPAGRPVPAPRPGLVVLCVLAVAALLLAACSTTDAPPPPAPDADPSAYAATLWPQRPVVSLSFTMAPDLHTADGHETVVFTPDLPTCDLVFRTWPDQPTMFTSGSSLVITDAVVDGRPLPWRMQPAGAPQGSPGTLADIPLDRCLTPGVPVTVDLSFRLTLGPDADERVGVSDSTGTAWVGTGFPLLAWVRGHGWVEDPAVPINGESVISEDFELKTLSVTARSEFAVVGTGTATGRSAGPDGTTVHTFSAPAVRDVSFAVGRYAVTDHDVLGVHVHVATPQAGTRSTPQQWADRIDTAITTLSRVFGPFPYPDLWVAVTPAQRDGSAFPGFIQIADSRPADVLPLVAHEISHEWFYALVGSDQATDPWLDEAPATFGAALVAGNVDDYRIEELPQGDLGRPMTYWAQNGGLAAYSDYVYNQGAAVLIAARRKVGPNRFDTALRSYITANAHRVATPADFARAFDGLPAVITLLRRAGAIPASG